MSSLSLRKLPKDIEAALVREARRKGKTKTDVVIEALENHLKVGKHARAQQLRDWAGQMTLKELREFEEATKCFEKIDEDMWK